MNKRISVFAMWIAVGVALGAGTGHMATWIAVGAGMAAVSMTQNGSCSIGRKKQ